MAVNSATQMKRLRISTNPSHFLSVLDRPIDDNSHRSLAHDSKNQTIIIIGWRGGNDDSNLLFIRWLDDAGQSRKCSLHCANIGMVMIDGNQLNSGNTARPDQLSSRRSRESG